MKIYIKCDSWNRFSGKFYVDKDVQKIKNSILHHEASKVKNAQIDDRYIL